MLGEDLTSARACVRELLKPGQHHLHMKDEADGRKETIAKTLAAADLRATVYDAGQRHRNQVLARAACLSALIDDLSDSNIETLIVLDQDETLVQSIVGCSTVPSVPQAAKQPCATSTGARQQNSYSNPRRLRLVLGKGWTVAGTHPACHHGANRLKTCPAR